jgi:hypothetical protein
VTRRRESVWVAARAVSASVEVEHVVVFVVLVLADRYTWRLM